ncbi:MAG: hypothetical protein LCH93_12410 [Proteobacteria bacterium]|nr:hypothetical protein [Pseudomonadota bacterium]
MLIQQDLLEIFDFVEPSDANAGTFSHRIHALMMRTCMEIEANFKAILSANGHAVRQTTMREYKKLEKTHRLSSYEIILPTWQGEGKVRRPFAKWPCSLPWYQAYNDAKHNRHDRFSAANLQNLVDSVCGLVAILGSQFYTCDFSPKADIVFVGESGLPEGHEVAIGGYFIVHFPSDWPEEDRYDFDWNDLSQKKSPFDNLVL